MWSTNLVERSNVAPRGALGSAVLKRRTRLIGIFPNDASITRLVGAVLLEQDDHWQLEVRRIFSADSMAAIPSLKDIPALDDDAE